MKQIIQPSRFKIRLLIILLSAAVRKNIVFENQKVPFLAIILDTTHGLSTMNQNSIVYRYILIKENTDRAPKEIKICQFILGFISVAGCSAEGFKSKVKHSWLILLLPDSRSYSSRFSFIVTFASDSRVCVNHCIWHRGGSYYSPFAHDENFGTIGTVSLQNPHVPSFVQNFPDVTRNQRTYKIFYWSLLDPRWTYLDPEVKKRILMFPVRWSWREHFHAQIASWFRQSIIWHSSLSLLE